MNIISKYIKDAKLLHLAKFSNFNILQVEIETTTIILMSPNLRKIKINYSTNKSIEDPLKKLPQKIEIELSINEREAVLFFEFVKYFKTKSFLRDLNPSKMSIKRNRPRNQYPKLQKITFSFSTFESLDLPNQAFWERLYSLSNNVGDLNNELNIKSFLLLKKEIEKDIDKGSLSLVSDLLNNINDVNDTSVGKEMSLLLLS